MTASFNDSAILAGSSLFQSRVRASLTSACISIATETDVANLHFRTSRASQILQSMELLSGNMPVWVLRFAIGVATDATCLADATQAGTVALTVANVDAQQALVTDAHMSNAISGQFNAFVNTA